MGFHVKGFVNGEKIFRYRELLADALVIAQQEWSKHDGNRADWIDVVNVETDSIIKAFECDCHKDPFEAE